MAISSVIDTAWHPLTDGCPPDWASAWGQDGYGVWVELTLEGVRQCLRWVPPGRFWMGSPESEAGRFEDEGPQHEVLLTEGYWLFDTPCTQALWETVMGDNPSSEFKSPDRPVERVSWHDVQAFLRQINERLPGLALTLPSEAQWEHACRAGTETATYAGDFDLQKGEGFSILDPIAWYSENSKGQAQPIAWKRPNPWGLYDMLGNVEEWCLDGWRDYSEEMQTNPLGPLETGARRAIRGGAWGIYARYVRAAYRGGIRPVDRRVILGFRCARAPA